MEIITSHGNADFDSFAAMLAAQKLHPRARIVFSGSKEAALQAFLDNPYYRFEELRIKELDRSAVERMILVDARHSSRLGPLSDIARDPKVELIVYDHHPEMESDLKPRRSLVRPYGAVTTLLLRILRRRKIPISKMEATIMALAIYEDTGFLTYQTTTPEDARQVAYLVECGADLSLVNTFLKRELSPEQLSLLNDLIADADHHCVNDVPVVVAQAEREDYIADAASVVHQIVELERYLVFIAVMRMGEKIHVIGRSRHSRINIGNALAAIGGGGHATAASAVVTNMTTVEVVETIISQLERSIAPTATARDIMTPDPHTIAAVAAISEARAKMVELNINSLPVERDGRIVGFVTRQQMDRAAAHKLRGSVGEVMNPDFTPAPPSTPIERIEELLMEGTERSILIGSDEDHIEGIVTRMDLFRRLYIERRYSKERAKIDFHSRKRNVNVADMLKKRLHRRVVEALDLATDTARERGQAVYLVGGIVRDLILNYANKDTDLVVLEDGIGFASDLASRGGGYIRAHPSFGTAVVVFPDDFRIDVATARVESYPFPGALPQVQKSSLRSDLYRRDFTINTLAVSLGPESFGELIDFFGGLRDLRNSKIRVLHGLSFIDDPTRILRAVRFMNRLSFALAEGTRQIMEAAVKKGMLRRVSGRRIHAELTLLFEDPRPLHAVELMSRFGILQAIHKHMRLDRFTADLITKINATLNWYRLTYLPGKPLRAVLFYMALFEKLKSVEMKSLVKRLRLPKKTAHTLLGYKKYVRQTLALFRPEEKPSPGALTELLDSAPLETVLFLHAFANKEAIRQAIANYLAIYSRLHPRIKGSDLTAMGLSPGPLFGRIFRRVRRALLDDTISTKEDELELVRREFLGNELPAEKG